jgi:uncharacterized protein YjbJ (UPF0337 family)
MMNNDQFAGTARAIGGRIEETAGAALQDRTLQTNGIVDQVKGAAQTIYGDTKDAISETYDRVIPAARDGIDRALSATRDHSLLALLAAGAVGFALAVAYRNTGASARRSWSA